MYYVIKVGKYYVKSVDTSFCGYINEIVLSNETMTGYDNEKVANDIAKKINGKVIKMKRRSNNDK